MKNCPQMVMSVEIPTAAGNRQSLIIINITYNQYFMSFKALARLLRYPLCVQSLAFSQAQT